MKLPFCLYLLPFVWPIFSQDPEDEILTVTISEAVNGLKNGKWGYILDIRPRNDEDSIKGYSTGHIPASVSAPYFLTNDKSTDHFLNVPSCIGLDFLIVSWDGSNTKAAAAKMISNGFQSVAILQEDGKSVGIKNWSENNELPFVSGDIAKDQIRTTGDMVCASTHWENACRVDKGSTKYQKDWCDKRAPVCKFVNDKCVVNFGDFLDYEEAAQDANADGCACKDTWTVFGMDTYSGCDSRKPGHSSPWCFVEDGANCDGSYLSFSSRDYWIECTDYVEVDHSINFCHDNPKNANMKGPDSYLRGVAKAPFGPFYSVAAKLKYMDSNRDGCNSFPRKYFDDRIALMFEEFGADCDVHTGVLAAEQAGAAGVIVVGLGSANKIHNTLKKNHNNREPNIPTVVINTWEWQWITGEVAAIDRITEIYCDPPYISTSPEEVFKLGTDAYDLVIDVRPKDSEKTILADLSGYADGHIEGAINLPSLDEEASVAEAMANSVLCKRAKILLYSWEGMAAQKAARQLVSLGFDNLFVMEGGGFNDWEYNGWPTASGDSPAIGDLPCMNGDECSFFDWKTAQEHNSRSCHKLTPELCENAYLSTKVGGTKVFVPCELMYNGDCHGNLACLVTEDEFNTPSCSDAADKDACDALDTCESKLDGDGKYTGCVDKGGEPTERPDCTVAKDEDSCLALACCKVKNGNKGKFKNCLPTETCGDDGSCESHTDEEACKNAGCKAKLKSGKFKSCTELGGGN